MAGRHRPSNRAHSPWWARLCVWFGAILMLGSGGVLVGGNLLLGNLAGNVETDNLLGTARKANAGRVTLEGPLNILMLGTDKREDWSSWQSDTIIMVHVPKEKDRAYLISFQRDTLVDIPANEKTGFEGARDKLNSAFSYGGRSGKGKEKFSVANGFQQMALTLNQLTNVEFDTGATIDFRGFIRVVRVLGGVRLCIETPKGQDSFKSIHKPYRLFKKGCRMYNAESALDYSRQRKQFDDEPGGGDFARMRHQQQVIKAILSQALARGFNDPSKIPALTKAAGESLLMDENIPIPDLAFALRKLTPENLTGIKVPVEAFNENGISYQKLVDGTADDLFTAIRDEKIDAWVANNPQYVNPL
ncbi:MAG: LCP family protein [Micromonosporaceae bacterium]